MIARRHAAIPAGALAAGLLLAFCGVRPFEPSLRAQEPSASPPSPAVRILAVPDTPGAYAVWGSTGQDRRGHIWFGLTSGTEEAPSAHLLELDPATDTITDRGNVLDELARLGLRKPGERQMKIHSRIVEGADGYQYFASMDESGESGDGTALPTWGGHLWRRGPSGRWEHLHATPQALIAVAVGGPYVYALGYFNHLVVQFDTRTRRVRSATVGSAGGHVSRNFFADERGHVFVPRVVESGSKLSAMLVELDANLNELGATPLAHYFEKGRDDSHGMVGIARGAKGSWYFTTGVGRLYQVTQAAAGASTVDDLGWFHPKGPSYAPSLFADASGALQGVTYGSNYGSDVFDWVRRDAVGRSSAAPLPYGNAPRFPRAAVLYGSMTRDAGGRFYVVGMMGGKPVLLQVAAGAPAPVSP